jgi:uncharacterized membrane protein YhaH (DUF805 family)
MPAAVGLWEHFRRLADFRGREDRASFWPYAALAFAIVMIVALAMFIPMVARSMRAIQDYARQHPDQVTVSSGPGHYSVSVNGNPPNLMPSGSALATYLGVTFGLAVLLYAAAVVRRLHDRGKSGAWGLMPLPFILYSSIQMPRVFAWTGTGPPDMALFFSILLSNLLYIAALIGLILLLAGPSDPEATRFDPGVRDIGRKA